MLADPDAGEDAKSPILDRVFAHATPSPSSMRAGPEYRLAMTRVLGERAHDLAYERQAAGGSA